MLAGEVGAAPEPAAIAPGGRARIALLPAGARRARARLLDAIEQAYPVRFEEPARAGGELAQEDFDGVLALGADAPSPADLPISLPCLCALGEEHRHESAVSEVALAAHDALARPLRGARVTERWTPPLPGDALAALAPGNTVLATVGGSPAWALERGADGALSRTFIAAAPAELAPGETLRERLAPGRCLALLALVHFVRRVARDRTLEAPLDAAFVLDDPNLHRPRYGHLHYAELARHARAHGYHMAIAMPPIDGWFAHPRAVRVFREYPAELSLCIHGNDHLGPELGRIASPAEGRTLGETALARAAAFAQRTGIPFEPVMVPPHEQLSEAAARGLLASGFLGVCVSRPYPWIEPRRPGPAASLSAGPAERGALAGWPPRELVAGGLPVLLRAGFDAPREDLALRAFLGQPLILYGHHDLLAHGVDVLAEATASIDRLGEVRWDSLARIARREREAARRLHEPHSSAPSAQDPALRSAERPRETARGAHAARRPALRPLLRRLASEARDRARA